MPANITPDSNLVHKAQSGYDLIKMIEEEVDQTLQARSRLDGDHHKEAVVEAGLQRVRRMIGLYDGTDPQAGPGR